MSRFSRHFRLTEADAVEYAQKELNVFEPDSKLVCKEIGDGNINYVFKIREEATQKSVIIKHADVALRNKPDRLLDSHRNHIEAEVLRLHGELVPGLVPKIYKHDPTMCCLVMEDISDHDNLRYALLERKTFPKLADHISTFMANVLLGTSDIIINPKEKKQLVKKFINPDLCQITEGLVYTDPYTNASGRNVIFGPNTKFVEKELYADTDLHCEVAKLKLSFMGNAQALIHGDLHSGSIFVKEDSTKIIDPEFAFYGPMGYDVGNVIGSLLLAWTNAYTTMPSGKAKDNFITYIEKTTTDVVEMFKTKFTRLFQEKVTDKMAKAEGFMEWFLDTVLAESAGVAGLEMHRRTVGVAKVKDITAISDPLKREKAERILILAGKDFVLNKDMYMKGLSYIRTMNKVANEIGFL